MKRNIPKKTLTRLQPKSFVNPEVDNIIRCLELAKECGDDIWRELMFTVMEEMELYQSEEFQKMKEEVIRRLRNEL
ncbi:MAG: hypothetical protein K2I06_10090 [Ruminococcus sp.]|nr:hypothetical protein [Ruminococcus sp.]